MNMDDLLKQKIEAVKGFCQMLEGESDPFLQRVQAEALWKLSMEIKNSIELKYRKALLPNWGEENQTTKRISE